MQFDAVFTVQKEFGKDVFLRQLLFNIAAGGNTPVDAVDATFHEVKEEVREVIVCTAQVSGRCNASVGYDRKEPYTDYETYKEKIGNEYVTRTRPVTKYRTVTDWRPFSTDYAGKATCAVYNFEDYSVHNEALGKAVATAKKSSITREGYAEVDAAGLSHALMMCEAQVEVSSARLPGDHQRDQQYNSHSEVELLTCYKLPFYSVVYTYQGKNYNAYGFACGDIYIEAEMPANKESVTALVERKTKRYGDAKKRAWILFTIAIIVATVLAFGYQFPWLFPVPILLLLHAKKASDKYEKKYNDCSAQHSERIGEAKMKALKAALAKNGLPPLDGNLAAIQENCSAPPAKKLKSIHGRMIVCWILVALVTLVSVSQVPRAYTKLTHTTNKVAVKMVDMRTEYDPDASPYINGCYYIHLDYEITAKGIGIDSLDLKVYVKDKKGNELGYITSSLSDLHINAREKRVITTSLKENQPEKNAFFTTLYQSNWKDLKFEFEVNGIRFADGEYASSQY